MATPQFRSMLTLARANHSVVSLGDLQQLGVHARQITRWEATGVLLRTGNRSFVVGGAAVTWEQQVAVGVADLEPDGMVGGRAAGRLLRLDGFARAAPEYLLNRPDRHHVTNGNIHSTHRLLPSDITRVDGLRCLTAEAVIMQSPLFGFSKRETENAIDSAIRLRLVDPVRLQARVASTSWRGVRGSRLLRSSMEFTGGEVFLERRLLELLQGAGLPRPELRRNVSSSASSYRLDAIFGERLVIELEGHETHSSREQRQSDEQRRTSLTLRGFVVITFTFNDLRDRPAWVVATIRHALRTVAA